MATIEARSFGIRLLGSALLLLSIGVQADSQRVTRYEYDGAGNIVGIVSGDNLGPPVINDLRPGFINRDQFVAVLASGENLFDVDVVTSTPGLVISAVFSASSDQVRFQLYAAPDAPIGPGVLTFTNGVGSTVVNVAISERVPIISTAPNPIALRADNEAREVRLVFDAPFANDLVFDVESRNPAVATLDETTITLVAGSTQVVLNARGRTLGTTTLDIEQPANFLALAVQIFVSDLTFPPGTYSFSARPVGVSVSVITPQTTSAVVAAQPVGVTASVITEAIRDGLFVAQPVGVSASIPGTVEVTGIVAAAPLGATLGLAVDEVVPSSAQRGVSTALVLRGVGLDEVTGVTFASSAGISIDAPLSVNTSGTELSLSITIDGTAATGLRVIELNTLSGVRLFSPGVLEITP